MPDPAVPVTQDQTASRGSHHRVPVSPEMAAIRGPRWTRATRAAVGALHRLYEHHHGEPFFLEISGPDPGMSRTAFIAWCLDDGAMWLAYDGAAVVGFLWFSYIQPTLGVANVDWAFLGGYPPRHSRQEAVFQQVFHYACQDLKLRKTHLLALTPQHDRIHLAHHLGFVPEGCLRQHFFHDGSLRDLLCFGHREASDGQG